MEHDAIWAITKDDQTAEPTGNVHFVLDGGALLHRVSWPRGLTSGCTVIHSTGDADLLIVQTAIQSARSVPTVLVGDDTDLLVLLCYHAEMDAHDLFFKPEPKQMSKKRRFWDIKKDPVFAGPVSVHKYFVCARISWM